QFLRPAPLLRYQSKAPREISSPPPKAEPRVEYRHFAGPSSHHYPSPPHTISILRRAIVPKGWRWTSHAESAAAAPTPPKRAAPLPPEDSRFLRRQRSKLLRPSRQTLPPPAK